MSLMLPTASALPLKGGELGTSRWQLCNEPTSISQPCEEGQQDRLWWHRREPEPETYPRRAQECRQLADAYLKMAGQYEQLANQAESELAGEQTVLP